MFTMFATAKPFRGAAAINQRNALESWKRLHASAEIILFGDEEGAAEVCAELGLRHEPRVERHDGSGLKYLDAMFRRAQEMAKHDYVCYANCDIVLLPDFRRALEIAIGWKTQFLLVGRRWDTEIAERIEFEKGGWAKEMRRLAQARGRQQMAEYIDYFVFPRGFYAEMPRLLIGRSYWDHWLVWSALEGGLPVIDASRYVVAVHQNHDHGYHAGGKAGTNTDELAARNVELAGGEQHLRCIHDATHAMTRGGRILATPMRGPLAKIYELRSKQAWLERTFELRKRLGLRRRRPGFEAAASGGAKR
jgi:hypothetical protein